MSSPGDDRPSHHPTDHPPDDTSDRSTSPKGNVEESRIIIRPDGEVVIENLSALLAEVASELDPDAELACRLELVDDAEATDPSGHRD